MNENFKQFESVYFDEENFASELRQVQELAEELFEAVDALKKEGINVNLATLKKITVSNKAYSQHIQSMKEEYLKKLGHVLKAEEERISGLYNDLYNKTLGRVEYVREAFQSPLELIKQVEGELIFNEEGVTQKLTQKHTYKVDVETMSEYYDALEELKQAQTKTKMIEDANGLPYFSEKENVIFGFTETGEPKKASYRDFVNGGLLPKTFYNIFKKRFLRK